jgi:hypothetical protein
MQAERHKLKDLDDGSLVGFVGLLMEAVNHGDRVAFLNAVGLSLPVKEVVKYLVTLREAILRRKHGLSIEDLSAIMTQLFGSLDQGAKRAVFLHLLKIGAVGMDERMVMLGIDAFLKEQLSTLLQEVIDKEERIAGYWRLPKRELILGKVLLMLPRKELHNLLVYVMKMMAPEALEDLVRLGAKSFIETLSNQVDEGKADAALFKKKEHELEHKLDQLHETAETNHSLMVKSAESSCEQIESIINSAAGLLQVLPPPPLPSPPLLSPPSSHRRRLSHAAGLHE